MWSEVINSLEGLTERMDELYEKVKTNPEDHKQVYELLSELRVLFDKAKKKTDELPELK